MASALNYWGVDDFRTGVQQGGNDPAARATRMRAWEDYIAQYPGAGIGGTGLTGLDKTDQAGWLKLQAEQQQYEQDKAAAHGQGPVSVRVLGGMASGGGTPGGTGMPNRRSLAALRGLGGGVSENDFFDPSGEDTARRHALADLSDEIETGTGLNPTAMHEQGLMGLDAERARLATRQRLDDLAVRDAEGAWLGPEGNQYASPGAAKLAQLLEATRRGVDLEGELQPQRQRLGDLESEAVAGRAFMPNTRALHGQTQADKLAQLRTQFVDPQEERTALALDKQRLANQGALDVANTRAETAQDRALKLVMTMLKYARVKDPDTGQSRQLNGDEMAEKVRAYGVATPQPGMVEMMSPDGTVRAVPPNQVDHFKALGATIVR